MIDPYISFKALCEDDLPLLHHWFQKPHIKKWYARGEIFSLDMIKEKYLPRIKNSDKIPNFIIDIDNKRIGYIQLYHLTDHLPEGVKDYRHPIFNCYKPEELVGIDLFVADENYIRKGYGSKILNTFINQYVKAKFRGLIVDPIKSNNRAILFFERNGFKVIESQDEAHALLLLKI